MQLRNALSVTKSMWLPLKCPCYSNCSNAVVGPWLNTGKPVLPLNYCLDLERERKQKGTDSEGWEACQKRFHRRDNPWAETSKMSAYSSGILEEGTVWAKKMQRWETASHIRFTSFTIASSSAMSSWFGMVTSSPALVKWFFSPALFSAAGEPDPF